MIAADDTGMHKAFSLSGGEASDAPEGRKSLSKVPISSAAHLAIDRACKDDETRKRAKNTGIEPVVPPTTLRNIRNAMRSKRLFRRLKECRRISTRYDKLDVVFTFLIMLVAIAKSLK